MDCPVEVPALFMGLCGFLGDSPYWMPRGAVIGEKGRTTHSRREGGGFHSALCFILVGRGASNKRKNRTSQAAAATGPSERPLFILSYFFRSPAGAVYYSKFEAK